MQRLSLDYQRSSATVTKIGIALLLIGLLIALYTTYQFRLAEQQLAIAEAHAGNLEHQIKRGNSTAKPTQLTPERQQEAKLANDILMQLALPWGGLFKALESNNTDKIALLAIQPDTGKHSIKIKGEAKNFNALLAYIQLLEQSNTMTDITLLNHEINQQVAEKPVRFTFTANWRIQP